jgi:hypothetical protein
VYGCRQEGREAHARYTQFWCAGENIHNLPLTILPTYYYCTYRTSPAVPLLDLLALLLSVVGSKLLGQSQLPTTLYLPLSSSANFPLVRQLSSRPLTSRPPFFPPLDTSTSFSPFCRFLPTDFIPVLTDTKDARFALLLGAQSLVLHSAFLAVLQLSWDGSLSTVLMNLPSVTTTPSLPSFLLPLAVRGRGSP